MKKLPKIYKQDIKKKINNNHSVYYSNTKDIKPEILTINVDEFLDVLFKEPGYIFNKALLIKTKDKTYDTAIVKKSDHYLYTLSDDKIKINDIVSIERK